MTISNRLPFILAAAVLGVLAVFAAALPSPASAQSSSSCVTLTYNMGLASTDATTAGEVTILQNYLIANGYLTGTTATGYYGSLTFGAVGKMQLALGVVTSSSDPGYGYTGPKTRNAIACSGTAKLSVTPATGTVPLTVQFTLENLNPSGTASITYTLDFSDGSAPYTTIAVGKDTVSHTYVAPGTYAAKLTNSSNATVGYATVVATAVSATAPWAVISPVSIATSSPNPLISGTAGNTATVNFSVYSSSNQEVFSSSVLTVTNGRWSGKVGTNLAIGSYTIKIYEGSAKSNTLANGTLTVVSATAPFVSVSPTSAVERSAITVSWGGVANPTTYDWIGLYPAGSTSYSSYISWMYVSSCSTTPGAVALVSGSCSFTLPAAVVGDYQIILLRNNGYLPMARSNTVSVTAAAPTPAPSATINASSLNSTSATPTISGTASNVSTVNFAVYSSSGQTMFSSGALAVSNGSWSAAVTMSLVSGSYTVKVYEGSTQSNTLANGTLVVSISTTPPPPSTAQLHVTPTSAAPGTTVSVSWSDIPSPTLSDWIGLYSADSTAYTSYITYRYTTCQTSADSTVRASGTCAFLLPNTLATGNYKFVLFSNNSYNPLATSETVAVAAGAPTANLTVNGGEDVTVNTGQTLTYAWSVTNAATVSATWSSDSTDTCGSSSSTLAPVYVPVSTRSGSYTTAAIPTCRAGRTYTVTYKVTGANGQTAQDSVTVRVNAATLAIQVSPTTASARSPVTVSWSGIPNAMPTDWFGLYASTQTDYAKHLTWRYVSCTASAGAYARASGSCSLVLPSGLAAGSYKFVLFPNNGYTPLATSGTLTVTAAQ